MRPRGVSLKGLRLPFHQRSLIGTPITVDSDAERLVTELRTKPGKDIALFGGGELLRSLLAAGLVDRVEVSIIPVLLGGIQPLPSPAGRTTLKLRKQRLYEKIGTIGLPVRHREGLILSCFGPVDFGPLLD